MSAMCVFPVTEHTDLGAFWNISFDANYLIEKNVADPDADGFYAFVIDWASGLRLAHGNVH